MAPLQSRSYVSDYNAWSLCRVVLYIDLMKEIQFSCKLKINMS